MIRFGLLLPLALVAASSPGSQVRQEVTVNEGTNMAAALSPDGSTIALDLLGRIWVVPAEGGVAEPLTDELGDARQPSWSPDGERIVFQAYWAGDYDIWTVGADGSGLSQLTAGPFDDREPAWHPSGDRVAFSSDRGGSYDIWALDLANGGLTRITEGADNEYGPAWRPESGADSLSGALVYSTDGETAGIWMFGDGGSVRLAHDPEGADRGFFAPAWIPGPTGYDVAYTLQTHGSSELYLAEVGGSGGSDGRGRLLSDEDEDVFPFRASWWGGSFVYTADGRLRSREVGGGPTADIPFTATVTLERAPYRRARRDFDDTDPRSVKGIVSPSLSPDGERVAFSALGDLWVMPVGGTPERLTDDHWIEADPSWSPDGRSLAFGSDRSGQLQVWVRDLVTGTDRQVTSQGGSLPVWSPDGERLAFKLPGRGLQGGIGVIELSGDRAGEVRTLRQGLNSPGRVTWSPDGASVAVSAHRPYSTRFREGVNGIMVVPVGPGPAAEEPMCLVPAASAAQEPTDRWLDMPPHHSAGTRATDGPVWSPDGRRMVYVAEGVLWSLPISSGEVAGPPVRLTNEISDDPTWSGDSRSILFLGSGGLRLLDVDDGGVTSLPVPLEWRRSLPTGRTVVYAGTLFDGVDPAPRGDMEIVIRSNRIEAVAPRGTTTPEPSDRIVDASDAFVGPGLIEMHTHGGLAGGEWLGRAWLSYGITSVRIPAGDGYDLAEARESVASSRRPGPRTFGTGGTVDGSRVYYSGAPALSSRSQIALELTRARALPYDLVKTYVRLPDVVQRRVIHEAHAIGLPVTSHELYPAVAFGADGVEHVRGTSRRGYSTKVTELNRSYGDVVSLLTASGMALTPTVGIYGAYGLLARDDPALLDDPRVRTFFPWAPLAVPQPGDPATGMDAADEAASRRLVSDMSSLARRVAEGGGVVVMGTDSPIIPQGLSYVAEMEALVRYGGLAPVDALRASTSTAAAVLGYEGELGVIAPGALADLVIFEASPLDEISNVRQLRITIADGRVYSVNELLEPPPEG